MHTLKFGTLKIKNFMSFGNNINEIDLGIEGCIHVIGQNLDDPDPKNGAGKTSLLNALSFVCYGKPVQKISLKNMQNMSNIDVPKAYTEVALTFTSPDNNQYTIARWITNGKQDVELRQVGIETPITPSSIAETDRKMEQLLGMSYDLFRRVVIFLGSDKSFFELDAAQQKAIMEELFRISELTHKGEELAENIKTTKESIKISQVIVDQQKDRQRHRLTQIQQAEQRLKTWDDAKITRLETAQIAIDELAGVDFLRQEVMFDGYNESRTKINTLTEKINTLDSEILTTVSNISKNEKLIEQLAQELEVANTINFDEQVIIFDTISEITSELAVLSTKEKSLYGEVTVKKLHISQWGNEVDTKQGVVDKLIAENISFKDKKCPTCKQTFHDDSVELKILDNEQQISLISAEIEVLKKNMSEESLVLIKLQNEHEACKLSIETKTGDVSDLKSALVVADTSKLNEMKNNSSLITQRLEGLVAQTDLMTSKLDGLKTSVVGLKTEKTDLQSSSTDLLSSLSFDSLSELYQAKNRLETLKDSVTNINGELNPHRDAYDALIAEGDIVIDSVEMDALVDLLEHQQFLHKLLTDKKSFIRKRITNRNIPFLNHRMANYLKEFGLPHVVRFNPDLSCTITEHDRELDYHNLSGGERKRLNLSHSMAMRDNQQFLNHKIGALFTDEIDGGSIGSMGIEAIIRCFKFKAKEDCIGLWMISHRPEVEGRLDHVVTVQKENGFSNIIIG